MLTKLTIKNFKQFANVEIPLGETVVFIGPNNSGKTSALQALALWDVGLRRWWDRRKDSKAKERTGVTINRRDLVAIPLPSAKLLWRDLHVRNVSRLNGSQKTTNVLCEISVEGVYNGVPWILGFEFDYTNEESFYCRAINLPDDLESQRAIVERAINRRIAYLPPMSGLAAQEFRKEAGEIGVLVGEGRTAEVLRNLCHGVHSASKDNKWNELTAQIYRLFKFELLPPEYSPERSELRMQYKTPNGLILDLSASGRGFQQTLLLLAYLFQNPNSTLLLDEPDAHLEIIRQRETYNLITEVATSQGSQILAASHSEVVLNEAAERDVVVAFVGKPHRIDSRSRSQAVKALKHIRFDLYYIAERRGWILFLEGPTDLAILRSLAKKLSHPSEAFLQEPPVDYVKNNIPAHARDVFYGLREAKPDLVGISIFDRVDGELRPDPPLRELSWRKREIENYIVSGSVLERFARHDQPDDLFGRAEADRRVQVMQASIVELERALQVTNKPSPWGPDSKITDDFLDPLFKNFYEKLGLPQLHFKRNYHTLADLLEPSEIDAEVVEKLNAIADIAGRGVPAS